MAISWNIYNIMLAVAIGIFSLGILYMGYVIATAPVGGVAEGIQGPIEPIVAQEGAGEKEPVGSGSLSLSGTGAEESLGVSLGAENPPKVSQKKSKKSKKQSNK